MRLREWAHTNWMYKIFIQKHRVSSSARHGIQTTLTHWHSSAGHMLYYHRRYVGDPFHSTSSSIQQQQSRWWHICPSPIFYHWLTCTHTYTHMCRSLLHHRLRKQINRNGEKNNTHNPVHPIVNLLFVVYISFKLAALASSNDDSIAVPGARNLVGTFVNAYK